MREAFVGLERPVDRSPGWFLDPRADGHLPNGRMCRLFSCSRNRVVGSEHLDCHFGMH
jgi:hypothetical protein